MHRIGSLSYDFCGGDFLPFLSEKSLNLAAASAYFVRRLCSDLRREMCAGHMVKGKKCEDCAWEVWEGCTERFC